MSEITEINPQKISFSKTVNFKKMSGRNSSSSLPSFMHGIHSHNGNNMVNALLLKKNNFSEHSLVEQQSSFNKKKSYNKFVNMAEINGIKLSNMYATELEQVEKLLRKYSKKSCELLNRSWFSNFAR